MAKQDLQKTTLWLSKRDAQKLSEYYGQRGSLSKVVRALIARHVSRLEAKTAEHIREPLTETEISL